MSSIAAASGRTSRGSRADGAGRGQREHGPDALAPGQERVAHGLLQARRGRRHGGEAQAGEVALDLVAEGVGVRPGVGDGHREGEPLLGGGRWRGSAWPLTGACPGPAGAPGGVAGQAIQLGAGLVGERRAVLHEARGRVRGQLAAAQLLGRTLEAGDEVVEGGGVELAHGA